MQYWIAYNWIPRKLQLFSLVLGLFTVQSTLLAQPTERLTGLSGRPASEATENVVKKKAAVSLTLPIVDDFSSNNPWPNQDIWMDSMVYINNHMAIDPITMGAATFDGLNKYGRAYDINRLASDTVDWLTSQPIDLSSTVDTVLLSFFYQEGGNGELPSSDDFLELQFYNPVTTQWSSVWKVLGTSTNSSFADVRIAITDPDYLNDGFQFRFMAFGSPAGAFDTWNIDYIWMREDLSPATNGENTLTDVSFIAQAPSLLKDYESIPWFHYNAVTAGGLNESTIDLRYRVNDDDNSALGQLILGIFRISVPPNPPLAEDLMGDFSLTGGHVTGVPIPFTVSITPQNFLLPSDPTGEIEIEGFYTYRGVGSTGYDSLNDILIRKQVFKNYYAYDDGTAERAYAVDGNTGGFIISNYRTQSANGDSLKGLYIYFPPANSDISQNSFSIVVYENLNGLPGTLLFETDSLYTPQFSANNFYLPYVLDSTIFVTNDVFIGVRQQNSIPLTIGFDKFNVGRTSSFFGTETDFYQALEPGTIMMRPFYRYLPQDISIPENELSEINFDLFPNPNQGSFRIATPEAKGNESFFYSVFSLSGQLIKSGTLDNSEISLIGSPAGVYLLQLTSSDISKKPSFKKLIIAR